MAGTAQALLVLFAIGVASAVAGPIVTFQDESDPVLSGQTIRIRVSVGSSKTTPEWSDEADLGRYLGSGLALDNGELYKTRMEQNQGLVKGVAVVDEEKAMPCGSQCASCNGATGQCTACLEGAVLIMDAASPNQLKCRSCSTLNCAEGACSDGFGCSACPAGFGISSSEPPFACIVACPPNCADCDDVRAADRSSGVGRCNACSQGYMLTKNGYCEEADSSPSLPLQQGPVPPDTVKDFLGWLLPGWALGDVQPQAQPTAPVSLDVNQARRAYLAAAALREGVQPTLPLERESPQASSSEQPALISFGDFDSAGYADARGAVRAGSVQTAAAAQQAGTPAIWLQWSPVAPGKGCIHKMLQGLLQKFTPLGDLLSGSADTRGESEPTQDAINLGGGLEWVPAGDGETEQEAWLREQGNAASRMDPEQPQPAAMPWRRAVGDAAEGGPQEADATWSAHMDSLLGWAEPESGDADREAVAVQPAELVKLTKAQPLGRAWMGLTASMFRPAVDANSAAQPGSSDTVKLTDLQPLGQSWTGLTASMLRAVPDQDALPDQLAVPIQDVVPDKESDSVAVLTSSSEEPRVAVVSREAVVTAARDLAANTGMDVDAALDRAVSAVLSAGSFAADAVEPLLLGARRFGPASSEAAGTAENFYDLGDGTAVGMAVPPQSGPSAEGRQKEKGLLSRVLEDIAGAVRGIGTALIRPLASRSLAAARGTEDLRIVPGVAAVEAAEEELEAASRDAEASVGADGSFPAAVLGRLQAVAEAAVRTRSDATDHDVIADSAAKSAVATAVQPIAFASGRGAASIKVPNVLEATPAAEVSSESVVPGVAAVFEEVAAEMDPSLVSDMSLVSIGQAPAQPGAGSVSANSLNNAIIQDGLQSDGSAAAFAYADPSLLS